MRIKMACAAVFATFAFAGTVHADSFFWAINQFTTIQKINGDTGAVVDAFLAPTNLNEASIAVVGNIGYYSNLGDANVYKADMTLAYSPGHRVQHREFRFHERHYE